MLLTILQLSKDSVAATTTVTNAVTTAAPVQDEISLLEMVMKGGPILIPLALLFLLVVYFMVERLIYLAKQSKNDKQLLYTLQEFIKKGDVASAISLCEKTNTPQSQMLKQGISRIGHSFQDIKEAMNASASLSLSYMEKNLNVLNIIGRIAPMFGFIGTIIGVIIIFYDISLAKTVEIEVISKGLYQKMISSASGLVVGVFAFVVYHWMNAKIDKTARHLEENQLALLDMLNQPE